MPLRRYFLYIGSVLLALLFITDWYLPPSSADRARSGIDRTIIRIHSAQKWPAAVVIDTTLLPNGLHTIAWSVADNVGHLTGIGSRFFIVQN